MNRTIGVFTDSHGLLEPTEAVIDDMNKKGIDEIYSLGDNIGVGPNSHEVISLLNENNVTSIAGNSEEYCLLGIEPFSIYFDSSKKSSYQWTLSQLSLNDLKTIKTYHHSIDLLLGGKKVALCHFANDVRCDYWEHSTYAYQSSIEYGKKGYNQFNYTNSDSQKKEVSKHLAMSSSNLGYISFNNDPIFNGKKVQYYDAILEGHVHFRLYEKGPKTEFLTLRAVGMPCGDPLDTAYYVTINEVENGYVLEEHLVPFDREKMEDSIRKSTSPDYTIRKFTGMGR